MNILIVNLHSAKNLGDEAINRSTILMVKEKYPNSQITLIANDPISWRHFHDVQVVPSFTYFLADSRTYRFNYIKVAWFVVLFIVFFFKKIIYSSNFYVANNNYNKVLDKIVEADLILSCGGGNYYTNSIIGFPFLINSFYIVLGKCFAKRIIFLPQSFGPFRLKFHKFILYSILNFADIIFVRDLISYDLISNLKIDTKKIKKSFDMAFFLERELNINRQKKEEFSVGITILDREKQLKGFINQDNYYLSIIEIIKHLISKFDAKINLIVQCGGPSYDQNDYFITQKLYYEIKNLSSKVQIVQNFESSIQLLELIQELDLTVASRMHTAIFSLIKNKLCLLIGYQPKSFGLYKQFGIEEFYIDNNRINPELSIEKIDKLINERHNIQESINTEIFPNIAVLRKELMDCL